MGSTLCYTSTKKAKNVPYVIDDSLYQQGSNVQLTLLVKMNGQWVAA